MSGSRVFEDTYNYQLQRGLDEGLDPATAMEQARSIASGAAATTVQLNTLLNTGLNMTALSGMFKTSDDIAGWFANGAGRRAEGESLQTWATRLREASNTPTVRRMLQGGSTLGQMGHIGLEMFQEGAEELTNQFAENTGVRVGKDGRRLGFLEQLGEVGNYFDEVMNTEGALNFVLGAVGGAAQTVLLDNVPMHRVATLGANGAIQTNEAGKPTYQFVSSRTRNAMGAQRYFENIAAAVDQDVQWYNRQSEALTKAAATGDLLQAERIKQALFDGRSYWSVMNGLGEGWKAQMDQIAELDNTITKAEKLVPEIAELNQQIQEIQDAGADPAEIEPLSNKVNSLTQELAINGELTEAVETGYAKDRGDNSYKERAAKAKTNIDTLTKMWKETEAKYQDPQSQTLGYPAFIFQRKADLMSRKGVLDDARREVAALEREATLPNAKTGTPDTIFISSLSNFQAQAMAAQRMADTIGRLKDAKAKGDTATMEDLVEQLGGSKEVVSLDKAVDDVIKTGEATLKQMADRLAQEEQTVLQSPGFSEFSAQDDWKSKSLEQRLDGYLDQQTNNRQGVMELAGLKSRIRAYEQETNMAEQATMYMESAEGRRKYFREATKAGQQQAKDVFDAMYTKTIESLREQADQRAARELARATARRDKAVREERIRELTITINELDKAIKDLVVDQVDDERINTEALRDMETRRATYDAELKILQQLQVAPEVAAQTATTPPKPTPVTKAAENVNEAKTSLASLVNSIPNAKVRAAINNMVNAELAQGLAAAMFDGGYEIPGDFFAAPVTAGAITPELAGQLLQTMRDEISAATNMGEQADVAEEPVAEEPAEEEVTAPVEEPEADPTPELDELGDDPGQPGPPDSEETPELTDEQYQEASTRHMGTKAMNAVKVNNLALEYDEVQDKEGNYVLRTASIQIREGYPEQLLNPGSVAVGTKLRLEVDEAWSGTTSVAQLNEIDRGAVQQENTFADYTDAAGNITDIDNVPIKIMTEDGILLGYLPRMDWVTAQYPGAVNYRNIVDEIITPQGDVIDNLAIEVAKLTKARQLVVANYQRGKTATVTVARSVGPGQVIQTERMTKGRLERTDGATKTRIPEKGLSMALLSSTGETPLAMTDRGISAENIVMPPVAANNMTGLLLPGYNGQNIFMPLRMRPINDTDVNTTVRVMEIFMGVGDPARNLAEAEDIFALTGFDPRTSQGLKGFINQFITYTRAFDYRHTNADVQAMQAAGISKPYFALNVTKTGKIMAGWIFSGRRPTEGWVNVDEGKLNTEFLAMLEEGLRNRPKNVVLSNPSEGLQGLNSDGEFTEVYYDKNGKLTKKTHENYNEYIKDKSFTSAVGTNQINGGRYIYTVNPQIELDLETMAESAANDPVEEVKPKIQEIVQADPEPDSLTDAEQADIEGLLGNLMKLPPPINEVGINPDGREVSLEVLERMYNFTPLQQRNGKSPQQVYEEMVHEGIGQIAEGYNPFTKCT